MRKNKLRMSRFYDTKVGVAPRGLESMEDVALKRKAKLQALKERANEKVTLKKLIKMIWTL